MDIELIGLESLYRGMSEFITSNRERVELYEWELAKLYLYNPEKFLDDEFTLNTISRTYKRIKTKESDISIMHLVKSAIGEN